MKSFPIFLSLIFTIGFSYSVFSQEHKNSKVISGSVVNEQLHDLEFVSVELVKVSSLKRLAIAITNENGKYIFKNVRGGRYRLNFTFIGLESQSRDFEISEDSDNYQIPRVIMIDSEFTLNTVEITSKLVRAIIIKKDTVEFNAASYKSHQGSVLEDILKKLPGVNVDRSGRIVAMGQTISQITINGKEFFTGDPSKASKYLPADVIDKIQVIDRTYDQSQFSGLLQESRTKVINIVTNSKKTEGSFGKLGAGYGIKNLYDVNTSANLFKKDLQFSLIGTANNVSENSSTPGQTSTKSAGVNLSSGGKGGANHNLSYSTDNSDQMVQMASETQTAFNNYTQISSNNTVNNDNRRGQKFSMMIDRKIGKTINFRVQPRVSINKTNTSMLSDYTNMSQSLSSFGNQQTRGVSDAVLVSNDFTIRKAFLKPGRSLSINLNATLSSFEDQSGYIRRSKVADSSLVLEDLNQRLISSRNQMQNTGTILYSEPIGAYSVIGLKYSANLIDGDADRVTFDFNPITGDYNSINSQFSNSFRNKSLIQTSGLLFSFIKKKSNLSIGLNLESNSQQTSLGQTSYKNFLPSGEFMFQLAETKRVSIRYEGRTIQPDISQLQPGLNNIDNLVSQEGNPDLKPSYSNSINIAYNNFNKRNSSLLYINGSISTNSGTIVPSLTLDSSTMKNISKFVNSGNSVTGMVNSMYSFPIISNNKLNLNIGLVLNANKTNTLINGLENSTNSLGINHNYRLNGQFDVIDFTLNTSLNYTSQFFSTKNSTTQSFLLFRTGVDLGWLIDDNLRLALNVDVNHTGGSGGGIDATYIPVNLSFTQSLLKSKAFTIKFTVNDLFNQNIGLTRIADALSITNRNFNVLKRYFFLSMSYSLNRLKG